MAKTREVFQEFKTKSRKELVERLNEAREELRRARFDVASNNQKSVAKLQSSKKLIAHILTSLHEHA